MKVLNRNVNRVLGIIGIVIFFIVIGTWLYEPSETVDLVVIGAGASGMSAALEAESLGMEVILLEKMPYVGGNTIVPLVV